MKVALDTNVFVSSVFDGPPGQVVELWFDGRLTLCLSEPVVTEQQRVFQEVGAADEAGERALIGAFASGEGVLYTADPSTIESVSSDPDDDNAEHVWRLEYALELEADRLEWGRIRSPKNRPAVRTLGVDYNNR